MLLSSAPKPEQGCLQGAEPQGKRCRAWGGEGQVPEGSGSTFGKKQVSEQSKRKRFPQLFSCFPNLSHLSHLEADRGAALTWALEGHPKEEGRAVVEVQWYDMKKGCSDHQRSPRLGRRLRMRGYGLMGKGQLGIASLPVPLPVSLLTLVPVLDKRLMK